MEPVDLRKYTQHSLKEVRKGRSESRLAARDEKIASRFYYYSEIMGLTYTTLMSKLSDEFDIDENVVRVRLKKRFDILDRLYADKPSKSALKQKYPYFVW